jgi:hypothetical protein
LDEVLASALLIATVLLPPPLAKWRVEIEKRDGRRVIPVRIFTDPERNAMILPEDTEARPVLRRFFLNDDFREQLSRAHALTVNWDGIEGRFHFIVLNMALADQWKGAEDAVLAHEFGHVWLNVTGYPSLPYQPGPDSCLAIHAGDVVQHILIRQEMQDRSIPHLSYWLPNLERSLEELEKAPSGPVPRCQKLAQLALWIDVRLGLTPETWEHLPRFLELMEKNYPELAPYAREICAYLSERDVGDREEYQRALEFSLRRFKEVFAALAH